jgi:histidine triad (HIT) family protein
MSDCLFCRIAAGDIPAKVVARTPRALAFHDINPQAPTHVLVIPTEHLGGPHDLGTEVAEQLGLAERGYRLVLNQGPDGGQSVAHVHIHILGGRRMKWPPG